MSPADQDRPATRSVGLRPSNADRAPYEQALAKAVAEGRLDQDTFESRLTAVAAATSEQALEATVADVPFPLRERQQARARRSSRRDLLLGVVGLVAVGGGSFWATRQWPEPATADPAPDATSTPSRTKVTSGTVSTEMLQLPLMQAGMFPAMVKHLLSIKVTRLTRVSASAKSVRAEGVRAGRTVSVDYDIDYAPKVQVGQPVETRTFPTARLRRLDAADLVKRSRRVVDLGKTPTIDVDDLDDGWGIRVADADDSESHVDWDLTGTTRLRT